MSELPDALGDLVGEHRPDGAPPFASLVGRRDRRRRARGGLAVVVVGMCAAAVAVPLAVGGDVEAERLEQPGSAGTAGGPAVPPGAGPDAVRGGGAFTEYLLVYGKDGVVYDPVRDEAALARCTALAGVTITSVRESYPPQITLTASSPTGLADRCLRALPGASLQTSVGSLSDGQDPDAPVTSARTGPADARLAGPPPGPGDTRISLLVRERGCASGQQATGRVQSAVDYADDEVRASVSVRPLDVAECPSNPDTPYELVLDEQLGDRRFVLNGTAVPR